MNKVILTGNITKDIEYQKTNNNVALCRFTIAVNRKFKKEDGTVDTDFINCVAWRNTAEFITKYAHKGNRVGLVGSIQTRTYDATDGTKRYVTEVLVEEFEIYTPKTENDSKPKTETQAKQETMQKFEPIDEDNLPF
jgi:single-strand DNA-binding protein